MKNFFTLFALFLFLWAGCDSSLVIPADEIEKIIDADGDGIEQYNDVDEIEALSSESGKIYTGDGQLKLEVGKLNPDIVTKYRFQISTDEGGFDESKEYEYWETTENYCFIAPETLINKEIHYWRAQAWDEKEGRWSDSWSEVCSFEYDFNFSPIPAGNDATAIEITEDLVLDWKDYPGEDEQDGGYTLELSLDPDFNDGTIIINDETEDSTYTISDGLVDNKAYYWRVKPKHSEVWSDPFTFVTFDINFVLGSPGSEMENIALLPEFTWADCSNGLNYVLQVSTSNDFIDQDKFVINDDSIESAEYTPSHPLDGNTKYYWRVGLSGYSQIWSEFSWFTTCDFNPSLSPLGTGGEAALLPTFNWEDYPGATVYNLQVCMDEDFNGDMVINETIELSEYTPAEALDDGVVYYWKVMPDNQEVLTNPLSFTTVDFKIISPIGGLEIDALSPTLEWTSYPGAGSYLIMMDINASFDSGNEKTYSTADASATFIMPDVLDENETYYWKIRPDNQEIWRTAGHFETKEFKFTLDTLGEDNQDIGLLPTLQWTAHPKPGAAYVLQISKNDADFDDETEIFVVDAEYPLGSGLEYGTNYHWRVRLDEEGSSWSDPQSFRTFNFTTTSTGEGQSLLPTLSWNAYPGADEYEIQLGRNNPPSDGVIINTNGLEQDIDTALDGNTDYYWHIRPKTEGNELPWSESWSFKTVDYKLVSPASDADIYGSPTLEWTAYPGAGSYTVLLSTDSGFAGGNISWTTADASASFAITDDLDENVTYYWKVMPDNQDVWSTPGEFVIKTYEYVIFPASGQNDINFSSLTLSWDAYPGTDVSYDIEVNKKADFTGDVIVASGNELSASQYTISNKLDLKTNYYWRIRQKEGSGDWSPWTSVYSFETRYVNLRDEYAGGYVFYINPAKDGGYVVSKSDFDSSGIQWNCGGLSYFYSTSTDFHSSDENTANIYAIDGNGGSYAARLCLDSSEAGFHDWVLPSINALREMYNVLALNNIGNFSHRYWSSSNNDADNAMYFSIVDGRDYVNPKRYYHNVRGMRGFGTMEY